MKLSAILEHLHHLREAKLAGDRTVDNIYFGPRDREVSKIAVTMFATVEVIRQAAAFGAQLLITHEPTFYHDSEAVDMSNPWHCAKKRLIDESGLTIYRYHDHPHFMPVDLIDEGTIRYSGLTGTITGKPYCAVTSFQLAQPMTARQIAETLESNLSTRHIRIAGALDTPGRNIAFACGTPGHIQECFDSPDTDFVVTGELCEWREAEYARNQAQLGGGKAILVTGHCISEFSGMRLLAEILRQDLAGQCEVDFISPGDVYSFTD